MGLSYINKNKSSEILGDNNKNEVLLVHSSKIRNIMDDDEEDIDIENDKNSLINSNLDKDSICSSSVSSSSTTDLSTVLGGIKDEEQRRLTDNQIQINDQPKPQLNQLQDLQHNEDEKVECEHYNYARLFFALGLLFYFPLIYSIMYIREPNKNVKAFARVSLATLILYPAFLILITVTTGRFDNGKYWEPTSRQWISRA
ncbi:hypothetical protein DICPUDRAFT_92788 [Dictyostelium purpureum]|uniref:Uncharacterized protein n=1 Tax=Dictyostelium purpureum TaxID=5786 RepID=F0ZX59_DICPU|nr:uncharacterized protein DICPUDRAFT_92788 [Dictyostelium purpureum]EGC31463.1 hypothetical protein DICPUDRAFT_92788 [Dictyostelium purpureum]|eukprot:XP_003292002.1 hypothetical protein DICPUDRAFT_92788 [Dictyostelium purpureum]